MSDEHPKFSSLITQYLPLIFHHFYKKTTMKKFCIILFIAFVNFKGNLLAQTNPIITRDVIFCYANEPLTTNIYALLVTYATANNVTVTKADSLSCIPNTFWIQLTGHQSDVLAVVNGISRTPPQDNPSQPIIGQMGILRAIRLPEPRRTDTISLFDNSCLTTRTGDLKPVIVALIDGGIEASNLTLANSHTAYFAPYLWHHPATQAIGYDFTSADINTYPTDSLGHGTNIAGLMVDMFKRFNATNVRLMILKTQNRSGTGRLWDIFRAIDKAVCNGANIVNMSLSGTTIRDTTNKGALNNLIQWLGESKKILVVAAAGNNNTNVSTSDKLYYAGSFSQPNLINVAALAPSGDSLWASSNYGATIDIAAPGVNIPCLQPFSTPVFKSGTSISTAYVSAVAAILATYRTTQTFDFVSVKTAIINGAVKSLIGSRNVSSHGWLNTCGALNNLKLIQGLMSNTTVNNKISYALGSALQVYPNPFDNEVNIVFSLNAPQRVELHVFNIVGQEVWSQSLTGTTGENQVNCRINNLSKGLFTFVVKTENYQWVQKVVKN